MKNDLSKIWSGAAILCFSTHQGGFCGWQTSTLHKPQHSSSLRVINFEIEVWTLKYYYKTSYK